MDTTHTHKYKDGDQSIGFRWYMAGGSSRLLVFIHGASCDATLSIAITPTQLVTLVNDSIHPSTERTSS